MDGHNLAVIGYLIATGVLAVLTVFFVARSKGGYRSRALLFALFASVVWAVVMALRAAGHMTSPYLWVSAEWGRDLTWLLAITRLLQVPTDFRSHTLLTPPVTAAVLLVAVTPAAWFALHAEAAVASRAVISVGFTMAVLILVACEQVFRVASHDSHSGLRYLCLGVGGFFAYDALIYLGEIAGLTENFQWQAARGYVNAMLCVPLGFGLWRNWHLLGEPARPRQVVFHAFVVSITGVVVLVTISGHYYLSARGGSWGQVAGLVVVAGVVIAATVLMISSSIRARVRVALMKTFFSYKYDYRREWLRFIGTLSASATERVPTTAVRAVAQIVNSPGGVVWVQLEEDEDYLPIGSWNHDIAGEGSISRDSPLIRFLDERQWIVNTQEMKVHPVRYDGLRPADVDSRGNNWWLVIPMFLGNRLLGFITLRRPQVVPVLNFEDHDLLRTVGRHVAMHINQAESDKKLAESSQFGAYNRLTAFLMHDLNNLIAQQSLVVKNAERFRHDQRFVDDAIETIANCVSRMTRLMEQLSNSGKESAMNRVDLVAVLRSAVSRCKARQPRPRLNLDDDEVFVLADNERLTYVFEHLIRNAQDATPATGEIDVDVSVNADAVSIRIRDTGEGMSQQFIRERLFRPFDSTKGSQAMGIGACQARDYIRSIGGQTTVESEVGAGTTFTVRIPLHE